MALNKEEFVMSDVFHLGLTKKDLNGATLAIVPGDPERVEKIAKLMDNPVHLASHRELPHGVQSLTANRSSFAQPVSVVRLPLSRLRNWPNWVSAPSCAWGRPARFSHISMWVTFW